MMNMAGMIMAYLIMKVVAMQKLEGVYDEIRELEKKIDDYGYNALKFGQPHLIENCNKHVE
jgi:hypothetical protein